MPARTDRRSRGLVARARAASRSIEALVAMRRPDRRSCSVSTRCSTRPTSSRSRRRTSPRPSSPRASAIYEVSRLIRQARVGQLFFGNAILPIANNSAGRRRRSPTSRESRTTSARAPTSIGVRGILLRRQVRLDDGRRDLQRELRHDDRDDGDDPLDLASTESSNFAPGTAPSIAIQDASLLLRGRRRLARDRDDRRRALPRSRCTTSGSSTPTGTWYTQTADTFTFSMNPQDAGAQQATTRRARGAPALDKPFAGGRRRRDPLLRRRGPGGRARAHRRHASRRSREAMFDPTSGQLRHPASRRRGRGLPGRLRRRRHRRRARPTRGSRRRRSTRPRSTRTSGWATSRPRSRRTLPLSATDPKHVDAFIDTSIPSGPPNPALATPALRARSGCRSSSSRRIPDFNYDGRARAGSRSSTPPPCPSRRRRAGPTGGGSSRSPSR